MFCQKCGYEVSEQASFCAQCGASLKKKASSGSKTLRILCNIGIVIQIIIFVLTIILNRYVFSMTGSIITNGLDSFEYLGSLALGTMWIAVICELLAPICFAVAMWRMKSLCDYTKLRFTKWYFICTWLMELFGLSTITEYKEFLLLILSTSVSIMLFLAFRGCKTIVLSKLYILMQVLEYILAVEFSIEALIVLVVSVGLSALIPVILILHAKELEKIKNAAEPTQNKIEI